MAIIKIRPRDILVQRATATLMELARFDVCDLVGEFEAERFFHWSELRAIQQEAERLGEDWWEIYFQAVCEEEIYGSDSDPEWRENE